MKKIFTYNIWNNILCKSCIIKTQDFLLKKKFNYGEK